MSVIIRGILFSSALLASSHPLAASFDCKQAKTDIEHAICNYPEIGLLDEELSKSYKTLLSSLPPDWKNDAIKNQRTWLKYLLESYSKKKAPNEALEGLKQALISRSKTLLEWRERGNTIIIDNNPINSSVCTQLLDRNNIRWMGRNQDNIGNDNFHLELPTSYAQPEWKELTPYVSFSSFNFYNHGKNDDVYKVHVENRNFQYTWYIVAATGEEELVKKKLINARGDQDLTEIAKHFDKASHRGFKSGHYPTANAATWPKANTSKLKTKLFDASATSLYQGWYTRSHLFFYGQQSYLAAESLNNLEGPTIALFKPLPDGTMAPLCYHNAIHSIEVNIKNQSAPSSTCPDELKKKDLFDAVQGCGKRTVIINLAEWGGARPVEQHCFTWGQMAETKISVGSIGAQAVTDRSLWQPLSELHDLILDSSQEIFSTTSGHYIRFFFGDEVREDSPPKGDDYYQIIGNSLKHVCHIGRKVIAPPGYPTLSHTK